MKTSIDVDTAGGGFTVAIARTDGDRLELEFATLERAGEVGLFLLQAFQQEHVLAIEESYARVTAILDKIEAQITGVRRDAH
jgi:hypothetical protein